MPYRYFGRDLRFTTVGDRQLVVEGNAAQLCLIPLHRHGSQPGRPLTDAVTILGSGDGADIILASSKVDSSHAVIVYLGPSVYLADLGAPGGTTLNGRRLRWARLANRDEIGIGPFRFRAEMTEGRGPFGDEEPVFSLRNDQAIGVVASIDPVLLVGSDPGCDVVLRHESIAPRHCLVAWTTEGPLVRDLQRRERIRLNGRRTNYARLVHGDSIGVGPFELVFEAVIKADDAGYASDKNGTFSSNTALPSDAGFLVAGRVDFDDLDTAEPVIIEAPTESLSPTEEPSPISTNAVIAAPAADEHLPSDGPDRQLPEEMGCANPPHQDRQVKQVDLELCLGSSAELEETGADLIAGDPEISLFHEIQHEQREDLAVPEVSQEQSPQGHQGQGGCSMTSNERPALQEIESRSQMLEERYADLRQRVAAAQQALDERARKLRDGLNQEREKLKTYRDDLQRQADLLLRFVRKSQNAETDGEPMQELPLEIQDEIKPETVAANTPLPEPQPKVLVEKGPPPVAKAADQPANGLSLQERARDLIMMVQIGRAEIDRTERKFDALTLDVQRLRGLVTRTRRRYQARDAELNVRFGTLEKDQQSLREERDKLLGQIRRLNAKELEIQTQMKDAETCRQELAREAERLSRSQEKLDEQQRALRVSVEEDRQRLRTRQAELRRKASEMAQATRERRRLVEEAMVNHEAVLEQREAEIKARRVAIEQASKEELQKTTQELEEILGLGLGRLDADLENRQNELELCLQKLFENPLGLLDEADGRDPAAGIESPSSTLTSFERESITGYDLDLGGELRDSGSARDFLTDEEASRLEVLVHEVEALRGTLARMEDRTQRRTDTPGASPDEQEALDALWSGKFAPSNVAQRREKNAALRGAPATSGNDSNHAGRIDENRKEQAIPA